MTAGSRSASCRPATATRSSSCTAPVGCSGTPSSTPSPPATASSRPSIRAPATRRASSTSRTCGTSSSTTTSCSTCSASSRATLVGHSFGGMVAAEIAANNPERVDRLVLIAPIGLWRDDHPVPDISGIPPEQLPGLVLADPEGPLAAMLPAPDPTDPEALFRGRDDDGQHPAVHLAAARQGSAQAAVPGEGADARRVGRRGPPRPPGLRRRRSWRPSPMLAWRSSTAPATSRSSSRPSGPIGAVTSFLA